MNIKSNLFSSEVKSIVSVNGFDSSEAGLLQCKRNKFTCCNLFFKSLLLLDMMLLS